MAIIEERVRKQGFWVEEGFFLECAAEKQEGECPRMCSSRDLDIADHAAIDGRRLGAGWNLWQMAWHYGEEHS